MRREPAPSGGKGKLIFEPKDDEYILECLRKNMSRREIARHFVNWCSETIVRQHINSIVPIEDRMRESNVPTQKVVIYGKSSWTREQDKILEELYPDNSNQRIAEVLKKNAVTIAKRARLLGFKKSAEYISSTLRNNCTKKPTPRTSKSQNACIGRFCARKTDCKHYKDWLALKASGVEIETSNTLNHGCTTRCIGEQNYTNFLLIEEES